MVGELLSPTCFVWRVLASLGSRLLINVWAVFTLAAVLLPCHANPEGYWVWMKKPYLNPGSSILAFHQKSIIWWEEYVGKVSLTHKSLLKCRDWDTSGNALMTCSSLNWLGKLNNGLGSVINYKPHERVIHYWVTVQECSFLYAFQVKT